MSSNCCSGDMIQMKIEFLIDGFSNGFHVDYAGHTSCEALRNSKLARDNSQVVLDFVNKELDLGRIRGPFKDPPFSVMHVSPVSLRAKREPGKFRLIHALPLTIPATHA